MRGDKRSAHRCSSLWRWGHGGGRQPQSVHIGVSRRVHLAAIKVQNLPAFVVAGLIDCPISTAATYACPLERPAAIEQRQGQRDRSTRRFVSDRYERIEVILIRDTHVVANSASVGVAVLAERKRKTLIASALGFTPGKDSNHVARVRAVV
jgi:hypothetical protein